MRGTSRLGRLIYGALPFPSPDRSRAPGIGFKAAPVPALSSHPLVAPLRFHERRSPIRALLCAGRVAPCSLGPSAPEAARRQGVGAALPSGPLLGGCARLARLPRHCPPPAPRRVPSMALSHPVRLAPALAMEWLIRCARLAPVALPRGMAAQFRSPSPSVPERSGPRSMAAQCRAAGGGAMLTVRGEAPVLELDWEVPCGSLAGEELAEPGAESWPSSGVRCWACGALELDGSRARRGAVARRNHKRLERRAA